jgi:hypothetical protein
MQRYNISVPKKYTKDGEEKTAWKNIGTLVQFPATDVKPEGFILELNMFPDTKFGVFEDKPREERASRDTASQAPKDEINPDDIPF